jgi:hypothetical protein
MNCASRIEEANLASKAAEAKSRAEATFKKKEIQAREATKARAEYEAAARAVAKKTERLRLLRLAKEAAEAKPQADPPPAPKTDC